MRIQATVSELDAQQQEFIRRNLRDEYKLPDGATRVCAVFDSDSALTGDRHVEMSVADFMGVLTGLAMTKVVQALNDGLKQAFADAKTSLGPAEDMTVEDMGWGVDSAVYHNRVLGEFHASDEDAVIPLACPNDDIPGRAHRPSGTCIR